MRLFCDFDILCTPKSNSNVLISLSELKPNIKYKARVINSRLKWEGKLSLCIIFFKVLGVTAFRVGKREPLTFAYSAIKSTPHISLWLKESLILPEEFESTLIQGQNSKYSHYSMRAVPLKRDELEGN